MSYKDWFTRFGYYNPEHEAMIRMYAYDPKKLTADRIAWHDQRAAEAIAEATQLIADLQEYRQALAKRYATLATAPYSRRLEIERQPATSWHGVNFYIRIIRKYEDGTEENELSEHYSGKERREALARFEALRKQFPGIETMKDIDRRSWER